MTVVIIVAALCYIIPTILMLLIFKYSKIGREASDTEIFRYSFIPVVNISCVLIIIASFVRDLLKRLPKPTIVDGFKRMVLKFVRGN